MESLAPSASRPYAFVVASDVTNDKPCAFLFQNYRSNSTVDVQHLSAQPSYTNSTPLQFPKIESLSCVPCNEIIRACMADPHQFKPVSINTRVFADGCLAASNPGFIALCEAHTIWPNRKIGLIMSIGTGTCLPAKDSAMQMSEQIHSQLFHTLQLLNQFGAALPKLIRFNPVMLEYSDSWSTDVNVWNKWKLWTMAYCDKHAMFLNVCK